MIVRCSAALLAALALFVGSSVTFADHHAPTPVEGPALTPTPMVEPMVVAPAAPIASAVVCCPIEVVNEKVTLAARRAYRRHGAGQSQMLCVDNPADCVGKLYSVPVCVPACCVGEPVCCGTRVGLLGRGYVTYQWPCGFQATIAFRVHGGVVITYH